MTTRRPRKRARGRPADTDSADTQQRILDAARAAFAERGYEATTNRDLAERADLTAGAIYHHFGTKSELYLAVHEAAVGLVTDRFAAAVEGPSTLRGKIHAVLDEAHDLNVEDPTLAQFMGSFRVDAQRDPELAAALEGTETSTHQLVESIVDVGLATGELRADERVEMMALLRVFLVGLTDAVSSDRLQHRHAVNAMKKLVDGQLIRTVDGNDGQDARSSRAATGGTQTE